MNTVEISFLRRENLKRLIEERFNGNQSSFSYATRIKAPQVNRWLSKSATDTRNINEKSARKIEKSLNLYHLWLDNEHSEENKEIITEDEIFTKNILKTIEFLSRLKNEKKEFSPYLQNSINEISKFATVSGKKAAHDLREIIDEKAKILNILSSKSILSIILDYLINSGDPDMADLAMSLKSMINNGDKISD